MAGTSHHRWLEEEGERGEGEEAGQGDLVSAVDVFRLVGEVGGGGGGGVSGGHGGMHNGSGGGGMREGRGTRG